MEPAWTQFESSNKNKVNLVMVNVDQKTTPEFKQYAKVIEGVESIPTTFWLDSNGKVLNSKVGGMDAKELQSETEAALKKAR